jgi:hypothetical protein
MPHYLYACSGMANSAVELMAVLANLAPVPGAVAGVAASRPRVLNSVGAVVAVRGVAQQGRGWPHRIDSDGDGAPAGLTSRFDPAESREEGSRVRPAPLSRARRVTVQEWAAQCHGADTGLVAQFPTVVGMGSP